MNPHDALQETTRWLPVGEVVLRLGVSVRAVQKRYAAGTLATRRVAGAGGEIWEVEAGAGHPFRLQGCQSRERKRT